MQAICDFLDRKSDEGMFIPCMALIDSSARQIGKVLVFVVYTLKIFLGFTAFAIILPYEQLYWSPYLLGLLSIWGILIFVNITYHYYKARTLKPIANPGKEGDRFCKHCQYFKSDRTHHCSICNRCILGMDHHCIWINQCVGAHNHRHFFLFIVYLSLAMLTIVIFGYHAAWNHIFIERAEFTFCTAALSFAPLQEEICHRGELARNCVIFAYMVSLLLFFLVGGLTLWNVFLISKGFTYIDYLAHSDKSYSNSSYRNPLNKGCRPNWRNFLGYGPRRSFIRNVIFPSYHTPILYDSYGRVENIELV